MNSEEELQELEKKLYAAADKMRGAVPVSSYKFIILGLIFLKYISDAFEERYRQLVENGDGMEEDRDSYTMDNIFYVPAKARWEYLNAHSKDANIGQYIDEALDEIEKENPSLKGVLIKEYNSPDYRNVNLGELIDLFTNIKIGSKEAQDKDILGRIYDPCCGSGGMFVQSTKFIERHQGKVQDLAIYGQEKNPTTWKLAKMNLAIRSLNGDIGKFADDTFQNDLHKGLKADFILANPPFNISDWGQEKLLQDPRWKYGIPPKGNANMAWVEHMIDKLSINGKAAIILANGALSSDTSGEGEIRKNILEADLVDCILAMPSNLFYTVTIPCSIWIINRNKKQIGKTLFIDAREMGNMVTRKLRELSDEDINKISSTYHNFINNVNYEDIAGFCKLADISEIKENNYVLTPGRYVGTKEVEDDGIPFEEKMKDLTSKLAKQMQESAKLDEEIKKVLGAIGYEI